MSRKIKASIDRYMNWVVSVNPKWVSLTVYASSSFIFAYVFVAILLLTVWLLYTILTSLPLIILGILFGIPIIYAWIKALFFQKGNQYGKTYE